MITIAVLLALALLGVILFLLFRIQTLSSIFRGTYNKRASTSNRVNAILFLVFLVVGGIAFFWSMYDAQKDFVIPIASVHAVWIESMFWTTMTILGIVFVLTHILLFWYSYKYQYQDDKRAYYYPHNNKLEVIWTIIPAVVMALLVFSGWKAWTKITNPAPADAIVVEIVGKQFNWLYRYPGKDNVLGVAKHTLIDATNELGIDLSGPKAQDDLFFSSGDIHIPKGKPVLFRIRSRDVTHDVYQPNFRIQMHAVPGMPTKFWFVPTKTNAEMAQETGNNDFKYEIVCNQICGRGHFAMRATLVVDEPEDYYAWLAEQKSFAEQNPDLLAKFQANKPQPVVAAKEEAKPVVEKAAL